MIRAFAALTVLDDEVVRTATCSNEAAQAFHEIERALHRLKDRATELGVEPTNDVEAYVERILRRLIHSRPLDEDDMPYEDD